MNKQLIVYMPLMILCMLKIKELKKMLKAMVLFFVLQLLEIALAMHRHLNVLNINMLKRYLPEFQFSVSGSRILCIGFGTGQISILCIGHPIL
jgi:hypothetical protein